MIDCFKKVFESAFCKIVEAVRHLQLLLNKMSLLSNCRIVESAIPGMHDYAITITCLSSSFIVFHVFSH